MIRRDFRKPRAGYCLENRHKSISINNQIKAVKIHDEINALLLEIDEDDNAGNFLAAESLEEELERLEARYFRIVFEQDDEELLAQEALTPIRNSLIDDWSRAHIAENFRFRSREDLREVLRLLQLPPNCVLGGGHAMNSERLMLIGLKRLSSEETLLSLASTLFGGHYSLIGKAFRYLTRHIAHHFAHKLENNLQYWLPRFPEFAEVIRVAINRHGPANLVLGASDLIAFIDGHNWFTCRPGGGPAAPGGPGVGRNPGILQEAAYSGYKRRHGLLTQTVEGPNGMCIHSWGQCSARHNDLFALGESGINDMLHNLPPPLGRQFGLFGDSIYPWWTNVRFV
jgi:hypothetical protein